MLTGSFGKLKNARKNYKCKVFFSASNRLILKTITYTCRTMSDYDSSIHSEKIDIKYVMFISCLCSFLSLKLEHLLF